MNENSADDSPIAPDLPAASTPAGPSLSGPTPRIRWAAIIWGAIAITIAVIALVITGSVERRTAFLRWASQLSGGDIGVLAVVIVGALVLLFGLLAVLRRQHPPIG